MHRKISKIPEIIDPDKVEVVLFKIMSDRSDMYERKPPIGKS
jgi:hypothetical protein